MLKSERLEFEILRYAQFGNDANGRSTSLGQLYVAISERGLREWTNGELVDAMKRLCSRGWLQLLRWDRGPQRFC